MSNVVFSVIGNAQLPNYLQFCYPFVCENDQCIFVDFLGIFVSPCIGQVLCGTDTALPFSRKH